MAFSRDSIIKNVSRALGIICILFLYFLLLLRSQDNDMFFEIASGRDILQGNFRTASHLNDFPVVVQQWMYSVSLVVFDKLGYLGHVLFVLIQNIVLWVLSGIFIFRKTKNKELSIVAPIVLTILSYEYMICIRPQIITMILLVAEILVIDIYHERKEIKYLFIVFPILLLAANFHQALFLYHIFILVPYYFKDNYKIDWKLVIFTPLFILCSLVTPYGIDGSLYIVRTFQSNAYDLFNINELKNLNVLSIQGIRYVLIIALTIVLIFKHKSNRYLNYYVFSISFLVLMTLRHISLTYFMLMFLVTAIDFSIFRKPKALIYVVLSAASLLAILLIPGGAPGDLRNKFGCLGYIIEDKDARIYNSFVDIGGYMEYCGYTKIHFDSRLEAFSKEISGIDNILEDLYLVRKGYKIEDETEKLVSDDEIVSVVEDYDYVIARNTDRVNIALSNSWNKLHEDNLVVIWENPEKKATGNQAG